MAEDLVERRSKEAVAEDVQRLKEWLRKQPHLPQKVDNVLLSAFVQGTKTLEAAKKKLDGFYSVRNRAPMLYDMRDSSQPKFKEQCKALETCIMPKPTPDGRRVVFWVITPEFESTFSHRQASTRALMLFDVALMCYPEATGYYLVIDLNGLPVSAATKLSPAIAALFLACFQDGYPIRLKGIYIINSPTFFEFIFNNIFKPFLKEKLIKRMTITGEGISAVTSTIPQELLPSNYGGKEEDSSQLNEFWLEELERRRDYFKLTSHHVADEKKRPPDGKNTYGIDGTFRKINVD